MNATLRELGEFGFIKAISKELESMTNGLVKGIGDDCAVLDISGDKLLLISTDMMVEGVHFISGSITPYDLGKKAVAVNLSDVAAMGGIPCHILVSIALHPETGTSTLFELYRGIKDACDRYGVSVIGGDTSSVVEEMVISITVMGKGNCNEILYRSGARPGDDIFLTGTVGDSAAGLSLIKKEALAIDAQVSTTLIDAHNRPEPRLEQGISIARSGLASSMIDISDGLVADLRHICEESRSGAVLFQSAIPLSDSLVSFSSINHVDPYQFALYGGEDYELLVTVPRRYREAFIEMFHREGLGKISRIGEITEADKGIYLLNLDEKRVPLKKHGGFDHFA